MFKIAILVLLAAAVAVAALAFFGRRSDDSQPSSDATVLAQLRKIGSDLSKPHVIEFFMYLPSDAAAQRVAESLRTKGFNVTVGPSARGDPERLTVATRSMVPELAEIERIRTMLTAISVSENGDFDGWGAPVVK